MKAELTSLTITVALCCSATAAVAAPQTGAAAEPSKTSNARTSSEGHRYNVSTSLWTTHFNPQPEHNNTQRFVGLERYGDNFVTIPLQERFIALEKSEPLLGLAHFNNSYAQSTWYAYAGFSRSLWQQGDLQAGLKVTAGFIHGYRNDFQYKIPFNSYGTSPAAIPSLTMRYRQFNTEAILFGLSGVMLNIGYSF